MLDLRCEAIVALSGEVELGSGCGGALRIGGRVDSAGGGTEGARGGTDGGGEDAATAPAGGGADDPTTGVVVTPGSSNDVGGAGGVGAGRPISVCESGAGRTLGEWAATAVVGASGGAVRVTGAMPINVCERRGTARTAGAAAGGSDRGGMEAARGATETRCGAGGGCEARGASTGASWAGAASGSAPQSVSMSSVEGGVEGNVRGGSLARRGGTDDAIP